jgi:hypothetical protein
MPLTFRIWISECNCATFFFTRAKFLCLMTTDVPRFLTGICLFTFLRVCLYRTLPVPSSVDVRVHIVAPHISCKELFHTVVNFISRLNPVVRNQAPPCDRLALLHPGRPAGPHRRPVPHLPPPVLHRRPRLLHRRAAPLPHPEPARHLRR